MEVYRLGNVKKGTRDIVVRYFFGAPTWIASPGLPPTPETEKNGFLAKKILIAIGKNRTFFDVVDDYH